MSSPEVVEIEVDRGLVLRGETTLAGDDWVVLVHDVGEDLDGWRVLRAGLVAQGMSVLTFDLRGHGGSDGDAGGELARDITAAIAYIGRLRPDRIFVGTSGSVTADVLRVAEVEPVDAVFALAPLVEGVALRRPIAKLVVAAADDAGQERALAEWQRLPGWTVVVRLPVKASGLELLRGEWCQNVVGYVTTFLNDVRRSLAAGRAGDG
jgi:pimeloyl-ACP methyl ester carboxylesterase